MVQSKMSRWLAASVCFGVCMLGTSNSGSEEPPAPATAKSVAMTDKEVHALVEQLGHEQFERREAASKKLVAGDVKVVGRMAAAVDDEKLEVSYRIVEILSKMRIGEDEQIAAAARGELKKLIKSGPPRIAKRARASFYARDKAPEGQPGDFVWANRAVVFGGGNKIRFAGDGGLTMNAHGITMGKRSVIIVSRVEDGVQKVVVHWGTGKLIVLQVSDDKLEVEVNDLLEDGSVKKVVYEVANAQELKEKHPSAFVHYEKYKKYKGGFIMSGRPIE